MSSQARNDLRGKLFSNNRDKFRSKDIELWGNTVTFRQPSLGDILESREIENPKDQLMYLLVKYCFVPGTDERVFEDTDKDAVMQWPFDDNLQQVNTVIEELTNVELMAKEAEKNLEEMPISST